LNKHESKGPDLIKADDTPIAGIVWLGKPNAKESSRRFLQVRVRRLMCEASRFASGNQTAEVSREIKKCQKKAAY